MKIPSPELIDKLEYRYGLNSDIISTIHKNFPKAVAQTAGMENNFKSASDIKSAFNVWKFLKTQIQYNKDPRDKQLIRLPSNFLNDKKGDCKSYSLFAAAILFNMGIPVAFRYTSYQLNPIPTHIYVVAKDRDKNKLMIIDGVYSKFNDQKKYTSKTDYLIKNGNTIIKRCR